MRWARAVVLGLLVAASPSGVALADAPGPTDFESTIIEITADDGAPLPEGFSLSVEGIDSFLLLDVEPGVTASVPGYDAEPYLRIDEDCSVWQNRLSWSAWYNDDRFGDVERPEFVDSDAAPDWELIDDDCSVAWHDHRIHWMETTPPIGAEPGDAVISSLVPVVIDDVSISVRVESTLLPSPSPRSTIAGVILGLAVVATVAVFGGRRIGASAAWLSVVAAAAAIVGTVTYLSTPGDTGPSPRWWVLPVVGLIGSVTGLVLDRCQQWFWANASVLLSGMMLGWWAWDRRTGLWRALIPSPWPGSVDRTTTAGVAIVAVAAIVGSLVVLFKPGTARSTR